MYLSLWNNSHNYFTAIIIISVAAVIIIMK